MPYDTAPEPAMPSRAALVDFFSRGLTAFQSSKDVFRVVCTLSRRSPAAAAGHDDIAAAPVPRPPREEQPPRRVRSLVVLDSSFNPPTLAHLQMAVSAIRDLQGGQPQERSAVRLLLLLAVNNADKKPTPAAFPVRLGMMHAFAQDLLDELRGPAPSSQGKESGKREREAVEGGEEDIDVDLGLTTMPYFHDKSQAISDEGFYAVDGEGPEQVYLAGYDTLIRIFNPKYYNAAAPSPSTTAGDGRGEAEAVAPIRRALDPFLERSKLRITMRTDDEWGNEGEQVAYLEKLRDGGLEEVGGRGAWAERVEMVRGMGEAVSSTRVREAAKRADEEGLGRLVGGRVKEWVLGEGLYRE
ncbi:nicotinamide mononucleotide adenylyltransferase [Colletotrichum spaethianum]|uniref:Nicotinamide mononucleotide adenylyltransferase n=1 Tax=Colletotrichum spaethianum TaxID=700344 RepID=A0AA37LI02_9PEZI|nr:nicotinamide mononucleotide adenylyltransferase [Colletotrichum spaethianum]GKT44442.1 nicotinamide mononucleotide adenylyltransferase [Colletotrichum spaethianum]